MVWLSIGGANVIVKEALPSSYPALPVRLHGYNVRKLCHVPYQQVILTSVQCCKTFWRENLDFPKNKECHKIPQNSTVMISGSKTYYFIDVISFRVSFPRNLSWEKLLLFVVNNNGREQEMNPRPPRQHCTIVAPKMDFHPENVL